jgi:hypothetical protein
MKPHLIWNNKVGAKKPGGAIAKDSETPDEGYDFTESLPWYIVIMHSPKTVWKRFLRRLS